MSIPSKWTGIPSTWNERIVTTAHVLTCSFQVDRMPVHLEGKLIGMLDSFSLECSCQRENAFSKRENARLFPSGKSLFPRDSLSKRRLLECSTLSKRQLYTDKQRNARWNARLFPRLLVSFQETSLSKRRLFPRDVSFQASVVHRQT